MSATEAAWQLFTCLLQAALCWKECMLSTDGKALWSLAVGTHQSAASSRQVLSRQVVSREKADVEAGASLYMYRYQHKSAFVDALYSALTILLKTCMPGCLSWCPSQDLCFGASRNGQEGKGVRGLLFWGLLQTNFRLGDHRLQCQLVKWGKAPAQIDGVRPCEACGCPDEDEECMLLHCPQYVINVQQSAG